MTPPRLPAPVLVEGDAALRRAVTDLQREDLIAVDTESNTLYAYRGRVCLIQLSTRSRDYIVDPLAIHDMQPLNALLADPAIEKVLHAAEFDIIMLRRDFDVVLQNLFDTMLALRLLGEGAVGLGRLLADYFGVVVDKEHQKDDWGARPLAADGLVYAQMDTHYLPHLRDQLAERLQAAGLMAEAREIFADVLTVDATPRTFDPDGFWRLGRPHRLSRRQMSILREVYHLREKIAYDDDKPVERVLSNQDLVAIARAAPRTFTGLLALNGVDSQLARRFGEDLLEAIERGRRKRLSSPPRRQRPDADENARYIDLHAWRKERAAERQIDANLILSKRVLWHLARETPASLDEMAQIEGFGPWRVEHYGASLLDVLAKHRKNGSHE